MLSSAFGCYIVSPAWKRCTFTLSLREQLRSTGDSHQPAQPADMLRTSRELSTRGQLTSPQGWEHGRAMAGDTRLL